MVPKAVLMRSGPISLTTARPVNTAQPKTTVNSARPMTNIFNKTHSTVRRPINNKTTFKNNKVNQRVNNVRGKEVTTARPKVVVNAIKGNNVNTASSKSVVNAVKGNHVNVVKALAWQSTNGFTESISGGYVVFGGNPKGGKITGR
ncbi:hypothetical protein Tco_0037417, partial [Tanacetum coccineum]